jgi:hypothetical protein
MIIHLNISLVNLKHIQHMTGLIIFAFLQNIMYGASFQTLSHHTEGPNTSALDQLNGRFAKLNKENYLNSSNQSHSSFKHSNHPFSKFSPALTPSPLSFAQFTQKAPQILNNPSKTPISK